MKTELKFGVGFAAAVMVYVLIEHVLGFNTTNHETGQYSRLIALIFPILATYYGIRAKRDNQFGSLTFGEGVKAGFLIALIQTTLTTLWFLFYAAVVNPEFLETLIRFERSRMAAAGAIEPEIAPKIEQLRWMYSLPVMPIFQMAAGTAFGTIWAVVFSWFLQKKAEPV
jgi:hypothetical protein